MERAGLLGPLSSFLGSGEWKEWSPGTGEAQEGSVVESAPWRAVSWQRGLSAMCSVRERAQEKDEGVSLHHHLSEAKRRGPPPSFGGLGIFKNKEVPKKIIKLVAYDTYT